MADFSSIPVAREAELTAIALLVAGHSRRATQRVVCVRLDILEQRDARVDPEHLVRSDTAQRRRLGRREQTDCAPSQDVALDSDDRKRRRRCVRSLRLFRRPSSHQACRRRPVPSAGPHLDRNRNPVFRQSDATAEEKDWSEGARRLIRGPEAAPKEKGGLAFDEEISLIREEQAQPGYRP